MIRLRPARQRGHFDFGWLDTCHSFSFGAYQDPDHEQFRTLRVINEDRIQPGQGFGTHGHRDMEILTWMLSGSLAHKDSSGRAGTIVPGDAQRMSAGTGIWHSEMNPSAERDVHFIQMWVTPDTEGIKPGYQQLDISKELDKGGLVAIASGRGHDAAIAIKQKGAVLWGGRLKPGETVLVPDARHVHLFAAKGGLELEGAGRLSAGDAVRLTAAGALKLTAEAETGAEVLIWETI